MKEEDNHMSLRKMLLKVAVNIFTVMYCSDTYSKRLSEKGFTQLSPKSAASLGFTHHSYNAFQLVVCYGAIT